LGGLSDKRLGEGCNLFFLGASVAKGADFSLFRAPFKSGAKKKCFKNRGKKKKKKKTLPPAQKGGLF